MAQNYHELRNQSPSVYQVLDVREREKDCTNNNHPVIRRFAIRVGKKRMLN